MANDVTYRSSDIGSIGSLPSSMPGARSASAGYSMMLNENNQWGPGDAFGTRLFEINGYQAFPGGFMMEWGITANAISGYGYSTNGYSNYNNNSGVYVYFHKAFPNNCLGVYGNGDEGFSYSSGFGTTTNYNTTFPSAGLTFSNISRLGFNVTNNTAIPMKCRWFAVGY